MLRRSADDSKLAEATQLRAWQRDGAALHLELAADARARVSIAVDGSVRIQAGAAGGAPADAERALDRAPWCAAKTQIREDEDGAVLMVSASREGSGRVELALDPFQLRVRDGAGAIVAQLGRFAFAPGGAARVDLASESGESIFGLGAGGSQLDRRGTRQNLRNRDADIGLRSRSHYLSIPFLLAHAGHRSRGVFLDALGPSRFDVAASDPEAIRIHSLSGGLDLCVFPGPRPADVLARFTARVGRSPLPPRWALGHHQSRWSYRSEREVLALAGEIRRRGIPTDAIHLDIDHMDAYRVFTWDPKRFTDPKGLLGELRRLGFRVVTIVDPGVKADDAYPVYRDGVERGYFCTKEDGSAYRLRVWPKESALPDFNRDTVRTWWGEQHRSLIDAGVSGIWNDMNEPAGWQRDLRIGRAILPYRSQQMRRVVQQDPVDETPGRVVPHESVRNIYGLQECRATHGFLAAAAAPTRPFVLTRSGGAGVQRYAAAWTGDIWSRWSHLQRSLPMLLNLSLSGVSFCGADIGGFAGSCSPELYARWIQIGALYPFARTHSAWFGRRQEPWRFGRRVESIARAALELRMRLLPYVYGLFRQAEATGAPVWRPLFYEFPDDAEAVGIEDQVMLGPCLLAAPVVTRGSRERELYLPPGVWWDWESDARYAGPRRLCVPAPLERLPLFVRAGSILPTGNPDRYVGEKPAGPLVLEVFPGAEGEAELVEDDGETTAYRDEDPPVLARVRLRLRDRAGGRLRLEIGRREGRFNLPERRLAIVVHGCPRPTDVFVDGQRLPRQSTPPGYESDGARTVIHLVDRGEARSVEVDPAP